MKTTLARLALAAFLAAAPIAAQTNASLAPVAMQQFFDASSGIALPCVGCVLNTYQAGTSTPLRTYTDSTATTQNPVNIQLDSQGYTPSGIWIAGACYKFVLVKPLGALAWSQDHICDNAQLLKVALASTGGAALVGFEQAGSSTPRTVAAKLQELAISVLDFGATGSGADDTAGFTAAQIGTCSQFSSRIVVIPAPASTGGYSISSTLAIPCDNITISGTGRLVKVVFSGSGAAWDTNGHSYVTFQNLFLASATGNVTDQVGIYVNGVTAGEIGTTIKDSYILAFGTRPATVTGSAIKVRGDNLSLQIFGNSFEVWGKGIDIDSTVDVLRIHDNTISASPGFDSGWGITLKNSAGSGQNLIEHNNFTTPGGAVSVGPIAGLIHIEDNQYEALGSVPLSNAQHAAFYLDSALNYIFTGNNVELHGLGDYCYYPANFSGGVFEDNLCGGAVVAQWFMGGIGPGGEFRKNTDFTGSPGYDNPSWLGISHTAFGNTFRGWGTQYPGAPIHFNLPDVPYSWGTTLAVAITSTSATSMTVASATRINAGAVLYLDAEQVFVGTPSGVSVPITRGYRGTTAATHLVNTPVTFGPAGQVLITSTQDPSMSMALGAETGFGYIKCRQKSANLYIPVPCYMDGLHVESTDAAHVNTKVVFKGTNGQADNVLEIQDFSGTVQVSVDNLFNIHVATLGAGKLPVCSNDGVLYSGTKTAGVLACP